MVVGVAVACVVAVGAARGVIVGDAAGSVAGALVALSVGVIPWEGTTAGMVAGGLGCPLRLSALGMGGYVTTRNSPTKRSASGSAQIAIPPSTFGISRGVRNRFSLSAGLFSSPLALILEYFIFVPCEREGGLDPMCSR